MISAHSHPAPAAPLNKCHPTSLKCSVYYSRVPIISPQRQIHRQTLPQFFRNVCSRVIQGTIPKSSQSTNQITTASKARGKLTFSSVLQSSCSNSPMNCSQVVLSLCLVVEDKLEWPNLAAKIAGYIYMFLATLSMFQIDCT